ncbi:LOW QUALITY PROTEIN: centromere protein S [Lontra canadensis]|uniref:LOW QUALITY PROTEIN: centromere protein S n=1 Tax=Lontra canadensis TaxID=76717 RepID=UPI0013F31A74|nr:LOW QUALITY PROTEIN: centromere protein S [Lontra canadensis]
MALRRRAPPPDHEGTFPERPPEGARGATTWSFALCPPARPVARRRGGKYDALLPATTSFCSRAPAGVCPAVMEEEEEGAAEEQQRFSYRQRLKAAVHYTVGCLCEEVASDKEVPFSKQTIAAISELTFRQCETFAKDLEMFARHAKRSTINTEDVKLLARRSNSLLKYITEKNEELTQFNTEQKAKKKKKLEDDNTKSVAVAAAADKDGS